MKNYIIWGLLAIMVIVFPITSWLYSKYIEMSGRLDLFAKNQSKITEMSLDNEEAIIRALDKLNVTHINNRYILSQKDGKKLIDVSLVCDQSNGVHCVTTKNGKLERIGIV